MAEPAAPKTAEDDLLRMTAEVVSAYVSNNTLATGQLADVIQAAAFFSWANRLMLTIGEPYYAEKAAG